MSTALPLSNWTIAVPESRELDVFAKMMVERGATAVRCPLVAIYDTPDVDTINAWLTEFIATPPDDLIMLTGEGIRRLTQFAERMEIKAEWIEALTSVRKISRGPKPGRALREIGLKPDLLASAPTTDGIIATLAQEALNSRRIAVQLYGENPNDKLQDFLRAQGAIVSAVAPYIYAPDSEAEQVTLLVDALLKHEIDVLTLTSTPQLARLMAVAEKNKTRDALHAALQQTVIAAIGPVVVDQLTELGLSATITPDVQFFMKPLVRKIMEYVELHPKG